MLFPSAIMWVVFGALSAYLARTRGKNPYLWFFLGMLFGVFGLLFLFFAPKQRAQAQKGQKVQDDPKTIDITPPFDPKYNEKFWYYLDGQNKQYGPMSFDALYRLYQETSISKQTFVWNEGLESWKPLNDFL